MNPLTHSLSLPDHATASGDVVAAKIVVEVYASGAMKVSGDITDCRWALAALDNAKDAIKGEHARRVGQIVIPSKDVSIG